MTEEMRSLRDLVGETIGEASMCWSPPPAGIFDSTRASKLIDRLADAIGSFGPYAGHHETFEDQLRRLLNTWSMEKTSDTPDFVLCRYMALCLETFSTAVRARDHWYGFKPFDANAATNTPTSKPEKVAES